jgi:hypothetical protein
LKDCHLCKERKLHGNWFFRSKLYRCYYKIGTGKAKPKPFPIRSAEYYCGHCLARLLREWCNTTGGKA